MRTLAFALGLCLSLPALAAPVCGSHSDVLGNLESKYAEVPAARGLSVNGAMYEVLVSPEGTWTLIATAPNGLTCLISAGEAWQGVPEPLKEGTKL